jgi:hypothetical protein
MTPHDCAALSDRMPDVASGRAAWLPGEQGELEACGECRSEWALLQAAVSLGADVEGSFDAAGAAVAVAARWKEAPTPSISPRRRAAYLALAAAAAILVVVVPRKAAPAPDAPPVYLSELDSLSTDELSLVADRLDLPLTELDGAADASLSDLDTTQLGRVLRSLEG